MPYRFIYTGHFFSREPQLPYNLMMNVINFCKHCGKPFNTDDPAESWCGKCPIVDRQGTGKRQQKLKLFSAFLVFKGKGVLVLAENGRDALAFILEKYELSNIWSLNEVEGPFEKNTVICTWDTADKDLVWDFTNWSDYTGVK